MLSLWILLLSLLIWRLHVSYSHFSMVPHGIPWSPRGRFTPYLVTQIAGIWNIPRVMEKAYQDYNKEGSACVIALPFSLPEVLLPQSLIRWMTKQSDKILSPIPVQYEVVGAEYAFLNSSVQKDSAVYDILRVQLNRNLPRLIPRISEELTTSIDRTFGLDPEWGEVQVYTLVRKVTARITAWLVLGGILSTDDKLVENLSKFSTSVIPSAIALSLFPPFLQPFTSRLTSIFNHIYMRRALKILSPHIEKRIIAVENGLLKDISRDDVLPWHIPEALRKKKPRFEMADVIACRVFATVLAALESTTLMMTYAIFNEEALGDFPTNVDRKSSNALHVADSVIKETLRLRTAIKALSVEVMQKDGLTIEDHMIHLPLGARVNISAWGIHHDEDIYPNAYAFDPFRFVPLHKGEGIQDTASLVTPSEIYVPFGLGKHSCPGRQFAAVVTKVFVAYLAVNYDLEEVHEKPRFLSLGHLPVPPVRAKLRVRRKPKLGEEEFSFFKGSEVIASLVPGGLDEFQKLTEDEKYEWRIKAINHVKNEAITSRRVAVVTGYFSFWPKEDDIPEVVLREGDLGTFTHIINLRPDVQTVMSNIESDKEDRSYMSHFTMEKLEGWQSRETSAMRESCGDKILFANIRSPLARSVLNLVRKFRKPPTAEANISEAEDGSLLLWDEVQGDDFEGGGTLLRYLYGGAMGYSDDAFREATVMLEDNTRKVKRRHGAGLVALRVSDNKFTGTKTTDTENRLFNTTHLA
ncbi:cytochrome P450 monooxygenase [Fusarium sp. NRRL 25303]|nr:cytochrome P450 monooxygenase [Fusarium sp. NRRL 25303]